MTIAIPSQSTSCACAFDYGRPFYAQRGPFCSRRLLMRLDILHRFPMLAAKLFRANVRVVVLAARRTVEQNAVLMMPVDLADDARRA